MKDAQRFLETFLPMLIQSAQAPDENSRSWRDELPNRAAERMAGAALLAMRKSLQDAKLDDTGATASSNLPACQ